MLVVPFTIDRAPALIRVMAGLLLVRHEAQKLFGAFGGHGIRGIAGWLRSTGVRGAMVFACLVALCESIAGLLFAIGLITPVGALALRVNIR